MIPTVTPTDPLVMTWGLVPRYLRERQAAEAAALARSRAAASAPQATEPVGEARAVDAGTPDLRRRVAAAARPPRHLPLAMVTRSQPAPRHWPDWRRSAAAV
jgi:hypothetical protein